MPSRIDHRRRQHNWGHHSNDHIREFPYRWNHGLLSDGDSVKLKRRSKDERLRRNRKTNYTQFALDKYNFRRRIWVMVDISQFETWLLNDVQGGGTQRDRRRMRVGR